MRERLTRTWWARLRASILALVAPPGRLTLDWMQGRRVGYLAPLSLLLWTNVAFFVVQSASGVSILSWPLRIHVSNDILGLATPLLRWRRAHVPESDATFTAAFEALENVHAKSLVVLMVPLLAVVVHVLRGWPRRAFGDALAFAAHFFTYVLICLAVLFPLVALTLAAMVRSGIQPSSDAIDGVVTVIEIALCTWYFDRALGTAFGGPQWLRAVRTLVLLFALAGILRLYHLAVFAVTLAAA